MATTITTTLPTVCFTSDIPDIACTTDASAVTFSVKINTLELYGVTLYPYEGVAVLHDIRPIVENYMRQQGVGYALVALFANEAFRVVHCVFSSNKLSLVATDFVYTRLLTTLPARLTTVGTPQLVHWYHSIGSYNVEIVASILTSSGVTTQRLYGATREYTAIGLDAVGLSSQIQIAYTDTLLSYVVSVNDNHNTLSATFYVSRQEPALVLQFRNSFNLIEYAVLWGTVTEVQEVEQSFGSLPRSIEPYNKSVTQTFEFVSAPLDNATTRWLGELLASDYILLNEEPIIITQSQLEVSEADDADSVLTFTYRYKTRRPYLSV